MSNCERRFAVAAVLPAPVELVAYDAHALLLVAILLRTLHRPHR